MSFKIVNIFCNKQMCHTNFIFSLYSSIGVLPFLNILKFEKMQSLARTLDLCLVTKK